MSLILPLLALLITADPSPGDRAPAPRLQRVSFATAAQGHTRIVRLHLDSRVTAFSDPESAGDGRLEITLYNTLRADTFRPDEPREPVAAYDLRTLRGHLILSLGLEGDVLSDVYRDSDSHDLIVTLAPTSAFDVTPRTTRPVELRAADVHASNLQEPSVRIATMARGEDGSPADNEISAAASRWRIDRIAIDAGHGGKDPGAVVGRVREKDVVLPIALKLGDYLEDLLGIEVIYTRSNDRFVTLRERGRIANRQEADLFISIHANNARNRSAHGTETFFLGMNKEGAATSVIERENSVILMESDQEHYEQFDQAALVQRQLAQSAFLRKSEELAARIEHQFSERVGRKSRGVKEGNLQVLWAAAMPAVLVEVGFISNASESRFVRSDSGVAYLASAIYRAVRDYKVEYEQSLSLSADD